jgi:hypothetical protein
MKHLTEEELVERAYGEGDAAVERHLANCAECAEAYAALRSDLAALAPVEPPARDTAYGERVWQSIAPSLPVYESRKQRWFSTGLWKGLSYAAVCALLVACAFYAGRHWDHWKQPAVAENKSPQVKQPIVVVVLSDHLDRSERLLVELKHADAGSAEMVSPMRDEARSLLAANRVCRKNVQKIDDPALATALDHLDRLLDGLANQPGSLNAEAITRLQDEMNTDGLLFQVRVLRARIPDRRTAEQDRSKDLSRGGTI